MNLLQFIAELVKALAWPLAVLVLGAVFRSEIRALLGRIRRGKVGPAELEFEATVKSLESESRLAPGTAPTATLTAPQVAMVASDPRAAIIGAWLQIEDAAEQLLFARARSTDEVPRNKAAQLRQLTRLGTLKPETVALLNDLRALRNQAVHEVEFAPSAESVLSYLRFANELLAAIHAAAGDAA